MQINWVALAIPLSTIEFLAAEMRHAHSTLLERFKIRSSRPETGSRSRRPLRSVVDLWVDRFWEAAGVRVDWLPAHELHLKVAFLGEALQEADAACGKLSLPAELLMACCSQAARECLGGRLAQQRRHLPSEAARGCGGHEARRSDGRLRRSWWRLAE